MKKTLFAATLAAFVIPFAPATAQAGPIERACASSDRNVSRALCRCIQAVADQTLTSRDQREAARFFRDPQLAQDVRMSKRAADNALWGRYRAFGAAAEARCTV